MGRPLINIQGQRFGRLIALEHPYKSKQWICRCDCGRLAYVVGAALRRGDTKSCGCFNSEAAAARKRTHGMTDTREYIIWCHAKTRCTNPNDKRWKDYGGRGIRMCDRWMNDFTAFLHDMGKRPTAKHSLDRINPDGDYEPSNCRWATAIQQANNTTRNYRVTWEGRTQTVHEWAREVGIPATRIYRRLKRDKQPPERALTEPVRAPGRPKR